MGSDGQDRWIERVAPAAHPDLAGFTGERYLPGVGGEIEAEHIHRYLFAAPLCEGRDVLDIACGEGYGAALLSTVASSVVGVDIDEPTIEHARRAYPQVEFEPGSCDDIPYMRDSFDVVVSFETIEHIEDHDKFLREVRRVLRPGGLFICSTPDRDVYRHPDGSNPYHARELTRAEFEQLLARRFANIRVLGQRLVNGSVIARGGASRTDLVTTRDGEAFAKSGVDDHATYLIAVCSDDRLPKIDDSILNDARYSIGRQLDLRNRLAALQRDLDAARSARDTAEAAMRDARARLEHTESALQSARAERDAAESERARLTEDRGRLLAEREAAERERDAAIRDAAAAQIDYERTAAELERVREEMIAAREKAAAAQANEAASRAERETLRVATAKAIAAKDHAAQAQKAAELALARAEERERHRAADLTASQTARAHAERAMREAEWMRNSRSWRWTGPLRLVSAAGRAAGVKALGLGVRTTSLLGLPGTERLRVARRAAIIRGSRLFDAGHYLAQNADVRAAGVDPAWHFAARGGFEGRDPGPDFSTRAYLDAYPDVAAAGVHPFEHFVTVGSREGRSPSPAAPPPVASDSILVPASKSQHLQQPDRPAAEIEIKPDPIPRIAVDPDQLARTKAIAFYLPQYHPIPENDQWWGKGFTEWTNVSRARPMFPGHRQPILPGELGFYDLRLPEARARQADLAREAGIHGFCYYHYWFNGRRVLERPLNEVLRLGEPDFPFCICWANENWTRRWDGLEQEILLRQQHSLASDRRFILDLIPYLEDDRYIRVDGRPVVLVYRPDLMVDACDTAAVWRDECARAGLGEIHLCAVQYRTADPRPLGFDAAVEFPPHHFPSPEITGRIRGLAPEFGGAVFDFQAGARALIDQPRRADYRLYRGVMPSWDNTARRMEQAHVFHGSSPELYEAWLGSAINQRQPEDGVRDNLVFINAWNEWAEGTVLEPRRDIGDAYLRATARVLKGAQTHAPAARHSAIDNTPAGPVTPPPPQSTPAPGIEHRVKRLVRTSPRLNAFVNRHPLLKARAAALLDRLSINGQADPSPGANPVLDRPRPTGRPIWSPGADEQVGDEPRSILIVSHDACLAGAQIVVLELLRHFANDPGIRVHHLLLGSGALEPEMRRLASTCCIDDLVGRGGSRAAAIADALDALPHSVELAICNTAATADALRACAKRDIPTVSYIHELPTTIDSMLGGEKTMRTIDRHAGRIVVVSRFVRDKLAAHYDLPTDRFEVVHMGTFPSRSKVPDRVAAARALRSEIGVDPTTPVVLGCGTIHHRKGTDLWVGAAARCVRRAREAGRPDPVFVWVGWDQCSKDLRLWCEHHAEWAGIRDRVRFIGARTDTARYFAGADVFALSSREDPFPLVSLEAMVCGTPVVAFEGAGGAPEALRIPGSEAGLTVSFGDASAMGDAIADLLADRELAMTLSQGGQEVSRGRLRWARYVWALLDGDPAAVLPDADRPEQHESDEPGTQPHAAQIAGEPGADRPRLLVVSHDACLGGSQLILLENLRHWTNERYDCRVVLLRGGALTPDFERLCTTARLDRSNDDPTAQSGERLGTLLDAWSDAGWSPDAAFCNTVASAPSLDTLAERGVPVVTAVYELPTTIDATLGGPPAMNRISERSHRIIVASQFVRDRLAAAYNIDPAELLPLHTGVLSVAQADTDELRAAVRAELKISDSTFLVLGCGAVHHRKGTDLFIQVAAETRRAAPDRDILFVWVGDDQSGATFGNWCRHDAERLGVSEIVRLVGARDDTAPWFAAADAFALTSREDPFPMVSLEALAAGVPVIAFDGAGGAPEAILNPDGDRGIVVPYMDTAAMGRAIASLAADPDLRRSLSDRAALYAAQHLDWERYIDAIDRLLAETGSRFAHHAPAEVTAP